MGPQPDSSDPPTKKVVVLGGGLAGLAAARSALELGYDVTLVEKRPFLGGRAYSFYDPQAEGEVDNEQHVFLGCCTYYRDFLRALGAEDQAFLQKSLRTDVFLNGNRGVLSSTPLLGPLHLMPSFLRYPHIGPMDKLLTVYCLIKAKLTDRAKHGDALDGETFYDWLKRHHQSERAIDNLWNLIILPALNDDVRHVSADMALMVLQVGLLGKPPDSAIGMARIGLTSLTGEPARRFIEERGGTLALGKTARALVMTDGLVSGVELSDGRLVEGDFYVSALPYDEIVRILPEDLAGDPFFAGIAGLTSSPIVGIHIWYDRPIMDQEFVAFLESPVQWVFNRTLIQGADSADGQYVCISVSGAWDFVERPKEELRELFATEMARLFPRAAQAVIERFLVVKQPQATFRSVPGASAHRPSQVTPVPNLFLAGDFTDTGWPSTMEGAVRSGVFAARALASRQ